MRETEQHRMQADYTASTQLQRCETNIMMTHHQLQRFNTRSKRLACYTICHLTLVMFLHYLTLHKSENLCCLPLNSVSGSEKNIFGV